MWVWYNGCAPAFQAGDMGSIPITHSNIEGFPSGQRGRTVNPLAELSKVRILPPRPIFLRARVVPQVRYKFDSYHRSGSTPLHVGTKTCILCGCSSVGRTRACQVRGRGFEPHYPLHFLF